MNIKQKLMAAIVEDLHSFLAIPINKRGSIYSNCIYDLCSYDLETQLSIIDETWETFSEMYGNG